MNKMGVRLLEPLHQSAHLAMSHISKTGTIKSFVKKGRTYETTEVAEKHSVFSKRVDQWAKTSGGGE